MRTVLYISLTEQVSGGEISILNYIFSLDKSVYKPLILCPKEGTLSEYARKHNISVIIHRISRLSKRHPWRYFQDLLWLINFIKKKQIDIIHGMSFYTCQLAGLSGHFSGIPVIIHGQNMLTSKTDIYINLLFTASKIVVCSRAVGDCLQSYISNNKIFLLRHAVQIPQRIPKKTCFIHKELGLSRNTKLIAHIGVLEERKCQDVFIHAAKRIVKEYANVVFLIIGDSLFNTVSYKNMLYCLRDNFALQNKVFFLGLRDDMLAILPELDIVVLPSYNEPLAMVTLEAGSYMKPYIGTYTGGTSEIIEHGKNGLLVQPKDVNDLYNAICFMLDNEKKARDMGVNAQETIRKECNISKNGRILCQLYEFLINKNY